MEVTIAYKQLSPIPVDEGGSGAQTLTGVLTGNGTSAFTANAVTEGGVLLGGASNAVSDTGVLAKGEILVGDGTTDPTKLTVGADDTLLTADSAQTSGVKWAAAGGGGAWELITTATASSDASIEFTNLSTTYFKYQIIINRIGPATAGAFLWMRTSTDNGSTFDSDATDYAYAMLTRTSAGSNSDFDQEDSKILLSHPSFGQGSLSANLGSWELNLLNPAGSGPTRVFYTNTYIEDDGLNINDIYNVGMGKRRSVGGSVDAIQFLYSSGNISQGNFKLYGLKAS